MVREPNLNRSDLGCDVLVKVLNSKITLQTNDNIRKPQSSVSFGHLVSYGSDSKTNLHNKHNNVFV